MNVAPAPTIRRAHRDMVRRLVAGRGRLSTDLGIDIEAGEAQIDRWFLAATLFGAADFDRNREAHLSRAR